MSTNEYVDEEYDTSRPIVLLRENKKCASCGEYCTVPYGVKTCDECTEATEVGC